MKSWHCPFDNPTALAWAHALAESTSFRHVNDAFNAALFRPLMKAKGASTLGRRNRVRNQRVAWRRPNPLPDTIDHANGKDLSDPLRQSDQRPRHRCQCIAGHHQRLPLCRTIRPGAGEILQDCR